MLPFLPPGTRPGIALMSMFGAHDNGSGRDRLRLCSAIVVPVRARGRVLGSLTLYAQHPYGRRSSAHDVHPAVDLASPPGLAVDNAWLYETEPPQ